MKKTVFTLALAFAISCGTDPGEKNAEDTGWAYYGENITPDNTIDALLAEKQLEGKDSVRLKLKGKITEVCQKKGCWMELDMGENPTLHVTFRDYGFFVPKESAGSETVIDGMIFRDTISIDHLKHLAQDAGKSEEEINKIIVPKLTLAFEATGVLIKKNK